MANVISNVKHEEVVHGFDAGTPVKWCTPKVLGTNGCLTATADGNKVVLKAELITPFGTFAKSFTIQGNLCFTWHPISRVALTVCIKDFKTQNGEICFTVSVKICVSVITQICSPQSSHSFCIPAPQNSMHGMIEGNKFDEGHFIQSLLASHMMGSEGGCNCN